MVFGPLFTGEKYAQSKTIQIFLSRNEIRVNKYRITGFLLEVLGFTWFLIRYEDSIEKRER